MADGSGTDLSTTNSAREIQGYSPILLPDSPSLEPYLQEIKQEYSESDSVDGDESEHD